MAVTLIVIGLTLLFSLHLSEVIIGPKDISVSITRCLKIILNYYHIDEYESVLFWVSYSILLYFASNHGIITIALNRFYYISLHFYQGHLLANFANKDMNYIWFIFAFQIFVLLMFSVSTASMLVMVLLGHFNKLTSDDHYKDQRRTTFLRGGMTGKGNEILHG